MERTIQKAMKEWLEFGEIDKVVTRMSTNETEALQLYHQQLRSEFG